MDGRYRDRRAHIPLKPGLIVFMHTGVPEKLGGQHIAGKLAAVGLEFAGQKGLTVIPLCPFVAGYLKKHQQYLDLVEKEYRERVTR